MPIVVVAATAIAIEKVIVGVIVVNLAVVSSPTSIAVAFVCGVE